MPPMDVDIKDLIESLESYIGSIDDLKKELEEMASVNAVEIAPGRYLEEFELEPYLEDGNGNEFVVRVAAITRSSEDKIREIEEIQYFRLDSIDYDVRIYIDTDMLR